MSTIVLATLNAKYAHAAFGLRYLYANLGDLRPRARLLEFDVTQRPVDIAEAILAADPAVVGLGVYIWNVAPATRLVGILKRARPDVTVILGGPEVSHGPADRAIVEAADHVLAGEGDLAFAALCRDVLAGRRPSEKVLRPPLPDLSALELPYPEYTDEDIARRVLYVEASRGCPFLCEFCLSALDETVRAFPLERFLGEMDALLERGAARFKFVDRTFNLNLRTSRAILEFFLARLRPGLHVHFEMIPDRLPDGLRDAIRAFPPGALQFEVGIQSFDEAVLARISRRQDAAKVEDNLRFLRRETGVHVHADLIVGLPGETMDGFGRGFDRLVALEPHEIQIGMLKRLHGAPIARHDTEWEMAYDPEPPYEILRTGAVEFADMQRMRRFARYWDLVGNSGNFAESLPLVWGDASPFAGFLAFGDWLWAEARRTHAIALPALTEYVFRWLVEGRRVPRDRAGAILVRDALRGGRRDPPEFLRAFLTPADAERAARRRAEAAERGSGLARQKRHAEGREPP